MCLIETRRRHLEALIGRQCLIHQRIQSRILKELPPAPLERRVAGIRLLPGGGRLPGRCLGRIRTVVVRPHGTGAQRRTQGRAQRDRAGAQPRRRWIPCLHFDASAGNVTTSPSFTESAGFTTTRSLVCTPLKIATVLPKSVPSFTGLK